jgi:hypothetical protein
MLAMHQVVGHQAEQVLVGHLLSQLDMNEAGKAEFIEFKRRNIIINPLTSCTKRFLAY